MIEIQPWKLYWHRHSPGYEKNFPILMVYLETGPMGNVTKRCYWGLLVWRRNGNFAIFTLPWRLGSMISDLKYLFRRWKHMLSF